MRWHLAAAFAADLALGLSLGLYYTVTYYGRALVPLPGFVALGAPFMYYIAVDEDYSTVVQAWLWMFVFPVTGLLWRLALVYVPRMGAKAADLEVRPMRLSEVSARLRYTCWPLLVPIPLLIWLVGTPSGQWAWADFIAVCLRRQNVEAPAWLTPLMIALALVAFVLEARAMWRLLPGSDRARRAAALLISVMIFILAVVVAGFALSMLFSAS
ncbi:MAG: hypothetical protein ACYC63_12680 [Armatimonadota bacterium]